VFHEFGGLGRGQGDGRPALTADAVVGHLGYGILGDPAAVEGKFEERGDDAAPVVVGLHARSVFLQKSDDGRQG
jgi:hypothetical protein